MYGIVQYRCTKCDSVMLKIADKFDKSDIIPCDHMYSWANLCGGDMVPQTWHPAGVVFYKSGPWADYAPSTMWKNDPTAQYYIGQMMFRMENLYSRFNHENMEEWYEFKRNVNKWLTDKGDNRSDETKREDRPDR